MFATDAVGRMEHVTPAFAALLGYSVTDLHGTLIHDLVEPGSPALAHLLPDTGDVPEATSVTLPFCDATGTVLPVTVSAMFLSAQGQRVRTVAAVETLPETPGVATALIAKAREADAANQAKTQFLAAMSHEIRTPMNAIMGFAQLLQMSGLDERQNGYVDAILTAGNSLVSLLTDLLDLSQVEAGHMRFDSRRVDLAEFMSEAADWWEAEAFSKGLTLDLQLDPRLPRAIKSDPVRLGQVINNLLGNAVKFTETGRIWLNVTGTRIGTGDRVALCFEVGDTGPGIDADQVKRLFLPFQRVDAGLPRAAGGWGLGLSICASIARHMGATLDVDTVPGEGSVFRFAFEASTAPEIATDNQTADAERPAAGLRILLAEDNRLNQEVLASYLSEQGHKVTLAADGNQVMAALDTGRFDVILMDVMMPGLDGIAATRRIRTGPAPACTLPIIACSANVSDEARAEAHAAGMTAFVAKPIEPRALQQALARATA